MEFNDVVYRINERFYYLEHGVNHTNFEQLRTDLFQVFDSAGKAVWEKALRFGGNSLHRIAFFFKEFAEC